MQAPQQTCLRRRPIWRRWSVVWNVRIPNHWRSVFEIVVTIGPFISLWLLACFALRLGYGIYLLPAILASAFLVRLFMIQHDCGHGAFFRQRLVNDWVGRTIGDANHIRI